MPKYRITSPEGKSFEITAPDGATQDEVLAYAQSQFVKQTPTPEQRPVEDKSMLAALGGALGQGVGNVALGAQNMIGSGLEKIGVDQVGKWLQKDAEQGKAKLQSEIQPYEDQHPMTVGSGRLGGEILATLPVGGALAKGASMVPGAAKVAPGLIDALRTGGMSSAGQTGAKALANRVAGGAITGGTSGALAAGDMQGAQTGAMIGGGLPVAGKLIQGAGTLARKAIGGTTGVGEDALSQAFRAGKAGGQVADDFTAGMRGTSNMDDVLTMAKQNLESMGRQKQAAYRQGMAGVKADKTVLDLKNVDQAVNDAVGMATFKGQIKNEKAAQALSQIKSCFQWAMLQSVIYRKKRASLFYPKRLHHLIVHERKATREDGPRREHFR